MSKTRLGPGRFCYVDPIGSLRTRFNVLESKVYVAEFSMSTALPGPRHP